MLSATALQLGEANVQCFKVVLVFHVTRQTTEAQAESFRKEIRRLASLVLHHPTTPTSSAPSSPTSVRENEGKEPRSTATSSGYVAISSRRSTSPVGTDTKHCPPDKSPFSSVNSGLSYFNARHLQKEINNDSANGWDSSRSVLQPSGERHGQFPGDKLTISPRTITRGVVEGAVDTYVSPRESPGRAGRGKRPPDLPVRQGVGVDRNKNKTSNSRGQDVGVCTAETEGGMTSSALKVSKQRLTP